MKQPDSDFLAQLAEIPEPAAGRSALPARPVSHPSTPTRATTRRRRIAAAALSAGWFALHLAIFGVRSDFRDLPALYLEAQVVLPFLLALGALAVALAAGRLGLGVSVGLVVSLAVLGPLSFCLIGSGAPAPSAPGPNASSLLAAFVCLDLTVAWAAVPLLLATLTLRGAFPAGAGSRGALVGAAAGLFAGATINLHCANVAPFHLLIGHGVPVVAATLLGALVVSRWTRS